MISLNKNPGVRPTGVGEVLRWIIGKIIGWVLKNDPQDVAGPLRTKTTTGLKGEAEAVIRTTKNIFEDDETKAVIPVDTSNTFNSLNQMVSLHEVQVLCPQFFPILINN